MCLKYVSVEKLRVRTRVFLGVLVEVASAAAHFFSQSNLREEVCDERVFWPWGEIRKSYLANVY